MSKNALAGWKKAVVYNPANGDRVQMNKISTEFSQAPDDPNIRTETGTGAVFGGKNYPLVIGFMDSGGLALLESWMVANTPVRIGVFAPAGQSILIFSSDEIQLIEGTGVDLRNGVKVHQVNTEIIGWPVDIEERKNLAKAIEFQNDQGELVFPFEGPELTLAADYASQAGAEMSIEAKDFSGAVLAQSTQAASNGRVSTSIVLPAGTWSVDIDLLSGGSADITNISLRGDGSQKFINY